MLLTLALIGPLPSSDVPQPQRVFDQSGGTIGRLPDNDWVLADARVSAHHAVVCFAGGIFYLEDTSRNGVFLNSSDRPLTRGQRYPLKSGDRLRIDPFQIEATVSVAPAVRLHEGSGGTDADAPSVDPLALLGLQSLDGGVPAPLQHPVPEPSSILQERCHLASPVPPILDAAPIKALPDVSVPAAPDERTAVGTLASMLAAAGVSGVAATPDLARRFGSLLRVVVDGMMRVLEARQQVKEDFRIGRTRFRPRDNNPLRLSANVDDALHNLLVKRNPAYLGLVEAFEDAFDELQDHQSATHAAMRTAFDAALGSFHSKRLSGHGLWARCRHLLGDAQPHRDESLHKLFGDEFKRAYDDERRRLKEARAVRPPVRTS